MIATIDYKKSMVQHFFLLLWHFKATLIIYSLHDWFSWYNWLVRQLSPCIFISAESVPKVFLGTISRLGLHLLTWFLPTASFGMPTSYMYIPSSNLLLYGYGTICYGIYEVIYEVFMRRLGSQWLHVLTCFHFWSVQTSRKVTSPW